MIGIPPRRLETVLVVSAFAGTLVAAILGLAHASSALLLFWLETAIVLAVGAVRGALRRAPKPAALALFFGFFLFVHLQFLIALAAADQGDSFLVFRPGFAPGLFVPLLLPALGLAVGHALAAPPKDALPAAAIARVLVLHVALVLGGFASFVLGTAVPVLFVLTALRLAAEFVPVRWPSRLSPRAA
ncbi:MAG: hypothetical protein QOD77_780 [Thermoplasmata archaeon]|jgi:hypothetical protein|nr:hypothetical protein [Thermoplasmata archaeon]